MGPLRLLPGEREELQFQPAPWGFAGQYSRALLPAVWGCVLAILFSSASWQHAPQPAHWYLFWGYFYGNAFAAFVFALGGLALGGLALAAARRFWRPIIVAGLLAGLIAGLALALQIPATQSLPPLLVLASLPLLVRAELCRSGTHHHITNLRIVRRDSFPRKSEQQALWSEVVDVDGRQGPIDRLLDCGTLIALGRSGKGAEQMEGRELLLRGVRRFGRILQLMELLAQQATAGEAVRKHEDLDARLGLAMAALHRK